MKTETFINPVYLQKKREIRSEHVKHHMTVMEEVLPKKLKLRDDIRSHFKANRQFNTLMCIVEKRKRKILVKEKTVKTTVLDSLCAEINDKAWELNELKSLRARNEMGTQIQMQLKDLVQAQHDNLRKKNLSIRLSQSNLNAKPFKEEHERFCILQNLAVVMVDNLERSTENFNQFLSNIIHLLKVEIIIDEWKISLKKLQGTEEHETLSNKLKLSMTVESIKYRKLAKQLVDINSKIQQFTDKTNKTIRLDVQEINDTTSTFYNQRLNISKQILNLNWQIYCDKKRVLEIDMEIKSLAMTGTFDMGAIEELKNIVVFMQGYEDVSEEYLGPVVKSLKTMPELEHKIWPQLSSVAYIILFVQGSTARMFHQKLVEHEINASSYTFRGIDEIITSTKPISTKLAEKIKLAEAMICDDFKFKDKLKMLLRENVIAKELNVASQTLTPDGITTLNKNHLLFQSVQLNILQAQGLSAIQMLKQIYQNVDKHVVLKSRIENASNLKVDLEEKLLEVEESYRQSIGTFQTLFSIPSVITAHRHICCLLQQKNDLQKRHSLTMLLSQELTRLNDEHEASIDLWNVQEIEERVHTKRNQLFDKRLMQDAQTLELEKDHDKKQLEGSIIKMEHHFEVLWKNFQSMNNQWDRLDDVSISIKASASEELMNLYQKHLKQCDDELEAINQSLQVSPPSTTHKSQLEVELMDIRFRLYEEKSEMSLINDAMRQCQEVLDRCKNNSNQYLDASIYQQFRKEPMNVIADRIEQCQRRLQMMNSDKMKLVSNEQYGHLIESIEKVKTYSNSPVSLRVSKVDRKAHPIINKLLCKMLKDAVYNYRLSFGAVMSDFIRKATLFFYTRRLFDEIKDDDFSWNCFDMGRLKAMDFVLNWKNSQSNSIGTASLRKTKGLLLILHIINYLSVFKFVIIDEKIYDVSYSTFICCTITFLLL